MLLYGTVGMPSWIPGMLEPHDNFWTIPSLEGLITPREYVHALGIEGFQATFRPPGTESE